MTSAAQHDSQELAAVLDQANTASDVWADSAYRSVEAEAMLAVMSGSNNLRLRQSGNGPCGRTVPAAPKKRNTG